MSIWREKKLNISLAKVKTEKVNGTIFDSQCLGTCDLGGGYAVDIVHSPREDVDNEIENQCESFRNGDVNKFIELDRDGKIVRIID